MAVSRKEILILGSIDSGLAGEEMFALSENGTEFGERFNSNILNSSGDPNILIDEYVPYNLRPETYIIPVLFAIIFIIGVAGNGSLILIFLKHRTMRNVPNMYIVSLAVGDILVILFCVPFTSTVYTVESWPFGLFVCKFSEFIKDVSIGVSVFTLTALSADRYFAIVDPMRKLQGRRATRITCIAIVGIWILSIIFALPALNSFIWTIEDTSNNHTYDVCYPFPQEFGPTYPKVVVMFKFLAYYTIPLAFIASFYVLMAYSLMQSTRNMPGEAPGQAKQIQSRKKVAKMVMLFVVIFALCFLPSHIFLLWFYYSPTATEDFNEFWNALRIAGFCLSFINSCLNPITLYCVSGTFRKHFNHHLFCCCCPDEVRVRGTRGGYGYSTTQTEHLCPDRITRNGTQISRASTIQTGSCQRPLSGPGSQSQPWGKKSESQNQLKPLIKAGRGSDTCGSGKDIKLGESRESYQLNHLNLNVSAMKMGSKPGLNETIAVGM